MGRLLALSVYESAVDSSQRGQGYCFILTILSFSRYFRLKTITVNQIMSICLLSARLNLMCNGLCFVQLAHWAFLRALISGTPRPWMVQHQKTPMVPCRALYTSKPAFLSALNQGPSRDCHIGLQLVYRRMDLW